LILLLRSDFGSKDLGSKEQGLSLECGFSLEQGFVEQAIGTSFGVG
jgi:hypothetical protein